MIHKAFQLCQVILDKRTGVEYFKSVVYANSTTTANKNIIPHARGLVNVEVDQPRFFMRQMSNAAPVERAEAKVSRIWGLKPLE